MQCKIKIGLFFGGSSREREISFAGGRTVYDNLDKSIFEPIPIFVDSLHNFILLNWQHLYKGTIRDFYPSIACVPKSDFQVYIESLESLTNKKTDRIIQSIGKKIFPAQFASLFDFAFLALHGPYGEDGSIQGLLEWYQIPYSGTGICGSAMGIDKIKQKIWMQQNKFAVPTYTIVSKKTWQSTPDKAKIWAHVMQTVGFPFVVKSPCQGSSIGVTVVAERSLETFIQAVHQSLFIQEITALAWQSMTIKARKNWLTQLIDLREGIGLPVVIDEKIIAHPDALYKFINHHFINSDQTLTLTSTQGEAAVLIEAFIKGREFSCIVIQDAIGKPIALPPTEIIKNKVYFDYRAKYLPGIVRKQTPIQLASTMVHAIRKACVQLFKALECQVYARIDGFITPKQIYLNDPNTTVGMNPSSFLFHQAAEIGLNPSQFLTFLIRVSLAERIKTQKVKPQAVSLLNNLDVSIAKNKQSNIKKTRVGVLMGGFSAERHISVESGRNIYEKLASSTQYTPIPIFLSGSSTQHQLFILPVNILLKDNADDIHQKLLHPSRTHSELLVSIQQAAQGVTDKYASQPMAQPHEISFAELIKYVDTMFIALHGRPGEDGTVQKILEQYRLPYNGSSIATSLCTINKFKTNETLKAQGVHVAAHKHITQVAWEKNMADVVHAIEAAFTYPFIAKPIDEGCSAAVIKINNTAELMAYAQAMFRITKDLSNTQAKILRLQPNIVFPQKKDFLIEAMIAQGDAQHFLEITGGLLTHGNAQGHVRYEIFEPSEALATGEVLSLEEKFLAGEGQNITPARLHANEGINQKLMQQVKRDLEKVAKILKIEGYARIDAFVKIDNANRLETWIIEVNTLPGMTPATCIFHQCAFHGYTPLDFIDAIIQYGLKEKLQKN